MNNFPGQPNYTPYDPYGGSSYSYMGGYRNYGPVNSYAQNQVLNGQNQSFQNMQQLPPQGQPNNNIQFVLIPSVDVAKNATAEKNQTIYMMNQNKPEIYAKAADGFGLQTTRYFKLVEFNPDQEAQQDMQTNGDFVTKDEFNRLVAAFSAEIEAIKQNAQNQILGEARIGEQNFIPQSNCANVDNDLGAASPIANVSSGNNRKNSAKETKA